MPSCESCGKGSEYVLGPLGTDGTSARHVCDECYKGKYSVETGRVDPIKAAVFEAAKPFGE